MSIARSLRKANYLRPVGDAIRNYISYMDKQREEEEFQQKIQGFVAEMNRIKGSDQRQISSMPMGSGINETSGQLGIPKPLGQSQFQNVPSFNVGTGVTPEQKYQESEALKGQFALENATPQNIGSILKGVGVEKPKETVLGEKEYGGAVYGTKNGITNFDKPLFNIPKEKKKYELSDGEMLTDENGNILRENKKEVTQKVNKPTVVKTYYKDGVKYTELSDGTTREDQVKPSNKETPQGKELRNAETKLKKLKALKPTIEKYTTDSEWFGLKGGEEKSDTTYGKEALSPTELKRAIQEQEATIKALKGEPTSKYFDDTDLSELAKYKKQGRTAEEIIKAAKLSKEEADELKRLYEGI